jgi:hypothetical protein
VKAIRPFRDHVGDYGSEWAAMCAISGRLGLSAETLRKWIRQAEVDGGQAPGVPTESAREIRELKRKNAELIESARPLDGWPRSLDFSDRQNVVYAATSVTGVIPRSWKSACMPMRRVS